MAKILSMQFPFQKGLLGFPRPALDEEAIRASIIQILTTAKGERVFRPDFGCAAFDFVFENDSDAFRMLVEREVRTSLTKWEPRVTIDIIEIDANPVTEPGQIILTVHYTIIASNISAKVTVAGT